MSPVPFLLTICLLFGATWAQNDENGDSVSEDPMIYFTPNNITEIREYNIITVNWYTTLPGAIDVIYITPDENVSRIINYTHNFDVGLPENYTGYGSFMVETLFLGLNSFNLTIIDENNETLGSAELPGSVILSYQTLNVVFTYGVFTLTCVAYACMGASLDLPLIVRTLKRPIGPAVGVITQYTIMPLASYGLANIFFPNDPLAMLGMFLMGCSPGGGLSNIWTYLFGGSMDLSITMTLVSTLLAFGAVPMWVFSLGPTIFSGTDFIIPFTNIVVLIFILVVPAGIGVIIQLWKPKVSKFVSDHVLKKIAILNVVYVALVGSFAYRYLFILMTPFTLLPAVLLPFTGFVCGFIIATVIRRPIEEIIAISIETGIQNSQIPVLILKLSLGSPTGDLAIVVPAAIVVLTPSILLSAYITKQYILPHLFSLCKRGKTAQISSENKMAVVNGKTNDGFVQGKDSYPVVPVESETGQGQENPIFLSDGTYYKNSYPEIIVDPPNGNENGVGNNGNGIENGVLRDENGVLRDENGVLRGENVASHDENGFHNMEKGIDRNK